MRQRVERRPGAGAWPRGRLLRGGPADVRRDAALLGCIGLIAFLVRAGPVLVGGGLDGYLRLRRWRLLRRCHRARPRRAAVPRPPVAPPAGHGGAARAVRRAGIRGRRRARIRDSSPDDHGDGCGECGPRGPARRPTWSRGGSARGGALCHLERGGNRRADNGSARAAAPARAHRAAAARRPGARPHRSWRGGRRPSRIRHVDPAVAWRNPPRCCCGGSGCGRSTTESCGR